MEGDRRVNWHTDNITFSQMLAILAILGVLFLALVEIELSAAVIAIASMMPIYAIIEALSVRSRVWIAFWAGSLFMGVAVYIIMTTST